MRKHLFLSRMAIGISILLVTGCARVTPVHVPNTPGSGLASTTGMPKESLDQFRETYPPANWPPKSSSNRLAVGPILLSREALLFLAGDNIRDVKARAIEGTSKTMLIAENLIGEPRFFVTENYSYEAQSVLVQELTDSKVFHVFALDRSLAEQLVGEQISLLNLSHDGIQYYLSGNAVTNKEEVKPVRLYLMLIETVTKQVRCAVSAQGTDLGDAARKGAQALLSRVEK